MSIDNHEEDEAPEAADPPAVPNEKFIGDAADLDYYPAQPQEEAAADETQQPEE